MMFFSIVKAMKASIMTILISLEMNLDLVVQSAKTAINTVARMLRKEEVAHMVTEAMILMEAEAMIRMATEVTLHMVTEAMVHMEKDQEVPAEVLIPTAIIEVSQEVDSTVMDEVAVAVGLKLKISKHKILEVVQETKKQLLRKDLEMVPTTTTLILAKLNSSEIVDQWERWDLIRKADTVVEA